MTATETKHTPEQVASWPTRDILAMLRSTRPDGAFAQHVAAGRAELARRCRLIFNR